LGFRTGRTLLEEHHPIRPQAVPRGFLRMYTVMLLASEPRTGYSLMQSIEERSGGTWRPGPGTIYPLLKALTDEGLIAARSAGKREGSVVYEITSRGRGVAAEMQKMMAFACRREGAMNHIFTDLLSPEVAAPLLVNRARDVFSAFHDVIDRVEPAEAARLLKEMRVTLEVEAGRIDARETAGKAGRGSKPRRARQPTA